MWDNMIGRQIRRSSRNLLIWNALILIGIIVFFVLSSRYWYNFFAGPFPMSGEQVAALKNDSNQQYYITTRADVCIDTGAREVYVKNNNKRDTAKYLAMFFGDKIMIVKTDMDAPGNDVERRGVLENVPDDVRRDIIAHGEAELNKNRDKWGGRPPTFMPVMLDCTVTRTKGFVGLAILIPLGLLNIFNMVRAVGRFSNPQSHPLAKALMKYGDPEEVAQKIHDEYESNDRQQVGPVTFTRSWMIRPTTFGVDAKFLGDSAWAYKTITQHYTNGVPTGKTYTANLCDIHGGQFTVQLKSEPQVDEFVVAVLQRVPWVLAGYDPELERLWKKERAQLFAIVDERRKNLAEEIRRQREQPDEVEEVQRADPSRDEPMDAEPA